MIKHFCDICSEELTKKEYAAGYHLRMRTPEVGKHHKNDVYVDEICTKCITRLAENIKITVGNIRDLKKGD